MKIQPPLLVLVLCAVPFGSFLFALTHWERSEGWQAHLRDVFLGAAWSVIWCGALHAAGYFVPDYS